MLAPTSKIVGRGFTGRFYTLTDSRSSRPFGNAIGHVSSKGKPGNIALIEDGDEIAIDFDQWHDDVLVDDEVLVDVVT